MFPEGQFNQGELHRAFKHISLGIRVEIILPTTALQCRVNINVFCRMNFCILSPIINFLSSKLFYLNHFCSNNLFYLNVITIAITVNISVTFLFKTNVFGL